jgi:hypothetical protein
MSTHLRHCSHDMAIVGAAILLTSVAWAGPGDFVPDETFTGSSLARWRVLGPAAWRAQDGEIVGTAKTTGGGGWLVSDRSHQDVAFFTSFRCTGSCNMGVLLRGEKTPDGGMKGPREQRDLPERDVEPEQSVLRW